MPTLLTPVSVLCPLPFQAQELKLDYGVSVFLDIPPPRPPWPRICLGMTPHGYPPSSPPPSLLWEPGLTKAESKLLTLADMGELQHLAPFLALAFAIPATTCKSNQELGPIES